MGIKASDVLGGGSRIDVKDASSRYDTKRYVAQNAKLGNVFHPRTGRPCETASQLDNAKAGVLLKYIASRSGIANVSVSEDERALLEEVCMMDDWAGKMDGADHNRIPGGANIKALLDDATSGGIEIAPIAFDDQIITFPLLEGEIFPRIDLVDVSRGRRIESGSIATPTVTWGKADNDPIDIFDTTSLVAAIDTSIHTCTTSVEVGLDFLSDAAVEVGGILTRLIGERLRSDLDRVVVAGDGVVEPLGITVASGITVVVTANGATGPPTLADYSNMMFTVPKQYRNEANGCAFVSNDVSFHRSRNIAVGTGDARPLLTGGDTTSFNTYRTLGWDHAIAPNLTNPTAIFGCLRKFRMYRRLGMSVRFETGGKELSRANKGLLIMRSRWGGQPMDANAFVKWTSGQS